MRARVILLGAGLLLVSTGCRLFRDREGNSRLNLGATPASQTRGGADDRKTDDWVRDRSRTADNRNPPRTWLDTPAVPGLAGRTPRTQPQPPRGIATGNPDALRRAISGVVEDADGRVVENAFVSFENANPAQNTHGAPIGVQTDQAGYFAIPELAVGQTYILTAQVKAGGRLYSGRQYVRVPNEGIRIQLREDLSLAPTGGAFPNAGLRNDLPPSPGGPTNIVPPSGGGGVIVPPVFDGPSGSGRESTLPFPAENRGGSAPWPPIAPTNPAPVRPDLFAPGPQPNFRSIPPANIPGPGATQPLPSVLPDGGSMSRSIPREADFKLVSAKGERSDLVSGRPADLVLLDFMTTTCIPCKKAVPVLNRLQKQYGTSALEVLAIVCEDVPPSQRGELVERYRADHRVQYPMLFEGAGNELQDHFDVSRYPTLILLDGRGRKLWTGHTNDIKKLEAILDDYLNARPAR